jgi:hypothetical protein
VNAITPAALDRRAGAARAAPRGLAAILRSLTWREFGFFLLVSLLISAINATSYFELAAKGHAPMKLLTSVVMPVLVVPFCVTGWLLANRGSDAPLGRLPRMILCAAGVALLSALLVPHLLGLIGLQFSGEVDFDGKLKHIPNWLMQTSLGLDVAFFTGLSFGVLEMSERRRRAELAVAAEQREQAALARRLLESRLAAMQAQVEPQFLFDALVDIERLYARDASAAADNLDRLIEYLRVALPRLREAGSSIKAEVELVESYLAVVQALNDGRPALSKWIEREAAYCTFYPMLLLPLIQRAVRRNAELPAKIELEVAHHAGGVRIVVRVAAGDLCAGNGELARVRERLHGLYGGRARLDCAEPRAGVTEFTLLLPT